MGGRQLFSAGAALYGGWLGKIVNFFQGDAAAPMPCQKPTDLIL
jgi:hypothetical protein